MTPYLRFVLSQMHRSVRKEAELSFGNGVQYFAHGVVWGAYGPGTALVL